MWNVGPGVGEDEVMQTDRSHCVDIAVTSVDALSFWKCFWKTDLSVLVYSRCLIEV